MKRIDAVLRKGVLAQLRTQASSQADLNSQVRDMLPQWLDASKIDASLDGAGILRIRAPVAQARTLSQILPSFAEKLSSCGVRMAVLERSSA